MNAWVTLLTNPGYLPGVRVLRASLAGAGSRYPLVVMVTEGISAGERALLEDDGCIVRPVDVLGPDSHLPTRYANARFAEVWTKLESWRLTEYDRIVVLDADMLVVADMDELFDLALVDGAIAASHACRCNPNRIASYPADWTPEHCFYTHSRGLDDLSFPDPADNYLNGGLLVIDPDETAFKELVTALADVEDLTRFPFAEQDFLNEVYRGRWQPVPYVYNALKTLPHQHPALWDAAAVKNIHYIIDKPWQARPDPADRYFPFTTRWWEVAASVPGLVRSLPASARPA